MGYHAITRPMFRQALGQVRGRRLGQSDSDLLLEPGFQISSSSGQPMDLMVDQNAPLTAYAGNAAISASQANNLPWYYGVPGYDVNGNYVGGNAIGGISNGSIFGSGATGSGSIFGSGATGSGLSSLLNTVPWYVWLATGGVALWLIAKK